VIGLAILGLSGLHTPFANAQSSAQSGSQDVQIFAGYLFGDRLLNQPLSGSTPRLDDSATYGARYTYHFADQWGVQLSAGYSPSRSAHVASGAGNLGLTTVDLDLQVASSFPIPSSASDTRGRTSSIPCPVSSARYP
jgi:hypothetical protein